jgi:molybdate transport system substrate-binding protein
MGFPPGSTVDILARPVAQRLTEAFGQPVIVDNRSGATGIIANEMVARAQPDGYTLLAAPSSSLTSTPHLAAKLPYDALRDFVAVAQLSAFGYVLVVNPGVPAKNLRELMALANSRPEGLTYGSSGNLARQIAQGAPYELFLSADEQYVQWLADRDLTRGGGELYGIGRIAIFAPHDSPLRPDERLSHLARRLSDGTAGRLAIANPEHAPYGRAAEQALRSLGLWEAARPHLVLGENVAQAAQFAASGNADGGIIAYSLVLAPELRRRGSFALIPESLHEPLRQRMVLLVGASPTTERFYDYLRSPAGRRILAGYGFALPGE